MGQGSTTHRYEDDAAVGELPCGVLEVGSPLRRRDADPHYCRRYAALITVGVAEAEQHHPHPRHLIILRLPLRLRLGARGRSCRGARPDHTAGSGGDGGRARHVAQLGSPPRPSQCARTRERERERERERGSFCVDGEPEVEGIRSCVIG